MTVKNSDVGERYGMGLRGDVLAEKWDLSRGGLYSGAI